MEWQEAGDDERRRMEVTIHTTEVGEPGDGVPAMDALVTSPCDDLKPWRLVAWKLIDPADDSDRPAQHAEVAVQALDSLITEARRLRAELCEVAIIEDDDDVPYGGDIVTVAQKVERALDDLYGVIEANTRA